MMLRRLISFIFYASAGALILANLSYAGNIPRNTQIGNLVFAMPKAWHSEKLGEHVILLPPGQKLPNPAMGIVITKSVPNLDIDIKTYLTRVADYFEAGRANRDPIQVKDESGFQVAFMRSGEPMPAGTMLRFYHVANPKGQGEAIMLFAFAESDTAQKIFQRFLASIGYVNLGDTVDSEPE